MSYTRQYNLQETPPSPFVTMRVSNPNDVTKVKNQVEALVDSGASISMITQSIIDDLDLTLVNYIGIGDYDGKVEFKPTYVVRIQFGIFDFTVIAVLTDDEPIIGRDIMNQLTTLMKGRTTELEMS